MYILTEEDGHCIMKIMLIEDFYIWYIPRSMRIALRYIILLLRMGMRGGWLHEKDDG